MTTGNVRERDEIHVFDEAQAACERGLQDDFAAADHRPRLEPYVVGECESNSPFGV